MKFLATLLVTGASLLAVPVANAQIIFDAFAGDAVTPHSNGTNAPPTVAVNATDATLTRADNQLSHIASNDNLQALNGGVALTATDVVQVSWTVDAITGYTLSPGGDNVNGIEFGLVSDNDFRGNPNFGTLSRFRGSRANVVNSNRVGHGFGNFLTGNNNGAQSESEQTEEEIVAGFPLEATEASFADGFTVVQTLTSAGVTTQYTDIVVTDQAGVATGGTTLTVSLDPYVDPSNAAALGLAPFDYATFINGAHFYAGADIGGDVDVAGASVPGGIVTFSNAQIEINPVVITPLLGDVNCDGQVSFLDIAPFIALLSNSGFDVKADINSDGVVSFLDIAPFIDILNGG